jgi:starch-binding outer membrane protein, SusD/RagB family
MKNIKIIFFSIVLLSCTEMLDQVDPMGPTGESFFSNSNELQQAVVAAYSGLSRPESFHQLGLVGFEQFSDNVYSGSSTTDGAHATWTTFAYDPQNTNIQRGYQGFYRMINACNQVITRGGEAGVSDAELNQAIAEVTFLRAFGHFFLTLVWGDVPIVTTLPADPAGFAPIASPAAEVYEQVIEDFQFAENNLSPTAAQGGRVTSWTAKAMLANVYLHGADELGRTEWYGLARQKAEEVINSGPYGLFDDLPTPAENLESIFQTFNENGKEHIFSVQHFNSGGDWSNGNVASQIPMAMNPRQMRARNNMWGFGWAYVYEAINGIWDDADARKDYNIWFQGEPIVVNGNTTGFYNQNNQNRCCQRPLGMGYQKYWYQEKTKNVNGASTMNVPVLRFAELLLIHAEADLLDDGNLSAAGLNSINRVRNRAGLPDLTAGEVTLGKILEERRWELFGEAKRWFDFVRKRNALPNLARQSFDAIIAGDTDGDDNDFQAFSPQRHFKLPYPQLAIDLNPNLRQKPEWSAAE